MFTQDSFGVRLEWGKDGLDALSPHCTAVIIVDVLSFSTSVDLIVGQGARVKLDPWTGEQYGPRRPSALKSVQAGTDIAMSSPNGGELARQAAKVTRVMAGCLRNANAVADKAIDVADRGPIGVIAAGEQWGVNLNERGTPGRLRPAIEDYLGAGAIISALLAEGYSPASPEAALAATSYRTAEPYLAELLGGCGSGLELGSKGLSEDIAIAGQVNVSKAAPLLTDGVFQ
ncbi:2-phosphosulfolactate phosphatase [Kibdelosporangium banguiense]|uniref:Probable 2-phosphosulfolactate phosphatase n=1 Tax=Kibdelosporangium banguiense TaxID=1365924 RepID=A0ABS4T5S0_9PSEU|nr:2-phosphosulfolactate phosphatase [Kibdelosporangium banguiense]MBP2319814.1 2-phosphosulfolactate phosphatase [Kibdelosporangium banguiense]